MEHTSLTKVSSVSVKKKSNVFTEHVAVGRAPNPSCWSIILLMITLCETISFYPNSYAGFANHGMMLNQLTGMSISYIPLLVLLFATMLFYVHTTEHGTKKPSNHLVLPMHADHTPHT